MPRWGRENQDGTLAEYPAALPNNTSVPHHPSSSLRYGDGHFLAVDTPQPALAWGESITEGAPAKIGNEWHRTWSVTSITLAEAKQQLSDLAVSIYWEKMSSTPTPQELVAGGGYVGTIQAREARWNPVLTSVRDDIQSASTVAEAYAIWLTLRDAA